MTTSLPVVAGIEISQDDHGRFNLNALHKASGGSSNKAPAQWCRHDNAKSLISEINKTVLNPIVSIPGRNGGTFAHEILAVEYAGWIRPAFRVQVNQTFIDYRKGNLKPVSVELSRMDLIQIAMEAETERLALRCEVEELTPKAQALDRIATWSNDSLTITAAAKSLQVQPKKLFTWLNINRWIYRRHGSKAWLGYQNRIQAGVIEHKVGTVELSDGSKKTVAQVRVTTKGLAKLAIKLGGGPDV